MSKQSAYVDLFILSHGDEDHLHGFKTNFYQGDPKNYKKKNQEDGVEIHDPGDLLVSTIW